MSASKDVLMSACSLRLLMSDSLYTRMPFTVFTISSARWSGSGGSVRLVAVGLEARDLQPEAVLAFSQTRDVQLSQPILSGQQLQSLISQSLDVLDAQIRFDEHAIALLACVAFLARLRLDRLTRNALGARLIAFDDAQHHPMIVQHFGIEASARRRHAVAVVGLPAAVLAAIERFAALRAAHLLLRRRAEGRREGGCRQNAEYANPHRDGYCAAGVFKVNRAA